MKQIFKLILIGVLLISLKGEASSLSFKSSNNNPGIGEQFYVDILLDTEGKRINGIEGGINFDSERLSFVRAEEGSSIISLWIEKPKLNENKIEFSGIIPNGFDGVIDPFNQSKKLPGLIIRLIFQGTKDGIADIKAGTFIGTLNDGFGTIENINSSGIKIEVKNINNLSVYKTEGDTKPELNAYVVRDPNIFNNKYVLVYDARDTKTGIKEISVKEGRRSWKKATGSPYLLEDQSRHSIISIQAVNYSGAGINMSIEGLPYKPFSLRNISIAVIILFTLLFIIKKIYEKYKKIHN